MFDRRLALLAFLFSCAEAPELMPEPDFQARSPAYADEIALPFTTLDPKSTPPPTPPRKPVLSTEVISTTHRYVPGAMFGGWGPHLGHLVRGAGGTLFFIDDACDQNGGAGACNVNVDRRLEYYALDAGAWQLRATLALPSGIQQNTGTIADGEVFASFGVDTINRAILECRMDPATWIGGCAAIVAAPLPPATNYVGAAITPNGYPMAWATTVADGGGGTFGWFVNYGEGWNGPRAGYVGGYNDASYVHIAFGAGERADRFIMHAELVLGSAPQWSFDAAYADGNATSGDAVAFALLGAASGDRLITTNDVVIDPASQDVHLLARTEAGAVAYVHRPSRGSFGAPIIAVDHALRARWVLLRDRTLIMVYGKNGGGLWYRSFAETDRIAGAPLDVANAPEHALALPPGYEDIQAIYTESAIYQRTDPETLNLAVVGGARQEEVLHVELH